MTEHTLGPWTACFETLGDKVIGFHIAAQPYGSARPVCEARQADKCAPNMKANAILIAAAPELLAIAKRWAALDAGAWHQERYAAEKAELLDNTRAAITKATGE